MSNVFSLDALREETEKEFAPVKIGLSDGSEATLRSLVRLNKKTREEVLSTLKALQTISDSEETTIEDVDRMVDAASKILALTATNGKQLVKELDGDLSLTMKVLEAWLEATQPGEASNSPASSTSTASSSSPTSDTTTESTS
jgi:hypothetical protein